MRYCASLTRVVCQPALVCSLCGCYTSRRVASIMSDIKYGGLGLHASVIWYLLVDSVGHSVVVHTLLAPTRTHHRP
jgi:hypothetical protein